ncbi:MAG: hypothetical protein ACKVHE_15085 [Planctomycetales bacterium]|jgi:hypothetical protein
MRDSQNKTYAVPDEWRFSRVLPTTNYQQCGRKQANNRNNGLPQGYALKNASFKR